MVPTGWRRWAHRLKRDTYALYLAYRDPRTPWYARVVGALVAAYALSPIDLIPDFIPIIGYLDDLLLLPLGIALAVRLIPPDVMADCRARAEEVMGRSAPSSRAAAVIVVGIWIGAAVAVTVAVVRRARG